eukprot:CAMPEP_0178856800 /NCGR_PEP_ID=MMETSP0746-20121128/24131_1 /TAXON_ID=913974 /ORGANISM="Nitzschia punctata, Strain CCMP561" /LENGTH=73 /DNA_ID=CAMNT_0020523021 /DNA_START=346 /DNA_END=567 /DNA_ORIENTATION=+
MAPLLLSQEYCKDPVRSTSGAVQTFPPFTPSIVPAFFLHTIPPVQAMPLSAEMVPLFMRHEYRPVQISAVPKS